MPESNVRCWRCNYKKPRRTSLETTINGRRTWTCRECAKALTATAGKE